MARAAKAPAVSRVEKIAINVETAIIIAFKEFGEYNYFDKGPNEVMDMDAIVAAMAKEKSVDVVDALVILSKDLGMLTKGAGEVFVQSFLSHVDGNPDFNPIFEDDVLFKKIEEFY